MYSCMYLTTPNTEGYISREDLLALRFDGEGGIFLPLVLGIVNLE